MNYEQLQEKHEKEIEELPMFFAFNDKQFSEGMEKIGASNESELCSIGGGGFIKKSDDSKMKEIIKSQITEMDTAMLNDEFLIDAFVYELANHEYCYTGDESETIDAIGIEELNDREEKLLREAKVIYREQSINY